METNTANDAWANAAISGVWDDYRIFGAVAETGSCTKAARLLKVQQSTVSRRLENLESRLRVRLFDRSARGISLTDRGAEILKHVQLAGLSIMQAERTARRANESIEGECKLLISEGLAVAWIIPFFLKRFQETYPNVRLRIHSNFNASKSQVPPFDIQIQYAPGTPDNDVITKKLAMFHFLHMASRDYLDARGTPLCVEDLASHHLVEVAESPTSTSFLSQYNDARVVGSSMLFANSGGIAASLTMGGLAIGFLPSYAYLLSSELVPVVTQVRKQAGVYATFTRTAGERAPVRAMIDFMHESVFDNRRMPWFRDGFELPSEPWRSIWSSMIAENGHRTKAVLGSIEI
jgi:DNA-binding transcriptional LysR family regulator